MFASIDMTEGNRVRRKSNQFDFPTSKGDVEPLRRYSGGEELMFQRSGALRKSPILAVSDDYYSHTRPGDSAEMSMKTIEMLALIKGTSPEHVYLQELSRCPVQDDDGQTSTEGSSAPHQSSASASEEFELDFDDDYLLGDSFIGFTEDGNLGESFDAELVHIEQGIRNTHLTHSLTATHCDSDDEPEDEIFDFEL